MKLIKNNMDTRGLPCSLISNKFKLIKLICFSVLITLLASCEDFVEVDLPKDRLTTKIVFEDANTATSALTNIYAQMRDGGVLFPGGLRISMGLYADEVDNLINSSSEFYNHLLLASNGTIASWWRDSYKLIYAANSVIEGVDNSISLSQENKNQLKGEALFIRGYLHSLLVELYGSIPYISTTDYVLNTTVARLPVDEVYNNIISDLINAEELLSDDITGERVRPYNGVVNALLARVYLYTGQWEASVTAADKVINAFVFEPDLNKVFLKNSSGSIWQFKPIREGVNSNEGTESIAFTTTPPVGNAISNSLLMAFESGDQRLVQWMGSVTDGTDTWYYPFKYKENSPTTISLEYSVLFRLAEQYLIRAEAKAQLGDISGAHQDLNIIRSRAGLANTTALTLDDLLEAILQERRVELFMEQGQRWFDLKRSGQASEVLSPIKPGWKDTDILLPIPEGELLVNPNLLPQNNGYN